MRIGNSKGLGPDLVSVLPRDVKAWYRCPHLLKLNLMLSCVTLYAATVGYDNSMMNGLQALEQWQEFMQFPEGAFLGGINAAQAGGAIFGYPIMSRLANRFGRKVPIWIGLAILALAVGLQTGARNSGTFIAARVLVGFASGFMGSCPILITEIAYPTHRAKLTAGYNTFYYVGSLVAAWATFGCRNYSSSWAWRIPSLLQFAVPALATTGFALSPESPRFLVATGQVERARHVLVKYHAGGKEDSELVTFEMAEIRNTLQSERELAQTTSYLEMFRTWGNRWRLLISVSYYLAAVLRTVGVTSVTQQTLINGFLQVWNLILSISAAALVDSLGRRLLFMTSSIGMLVCYIIMTGLSASFAQTSHTATGLAVIPIIFFYFGFYNIAFNPLLVAYPTEIWPYKLRSRGVAIMSSTTCIALFLNLFLNPVALERVGWRYYIVYVVILVGIVLTCWFLYPETRGHSLEEMAVIFDGDATTETRRESTMMEVLNRHGPENGVEDITHLQPKNWET